MFSTRLIADIEFRGFTRFLSKAIDRIYLWSDLKPSDCRLVNLANKEWNCMHPDEKYYFIKPSIHKLMTEFNKPIVDNENNGFRNYMFLERLHILLMDNSKYKQTSKSYVSLMSKRWRKFDDKEKTYYLQMNHSDIGAELIIHQRTRLHNLYPAQRLRLLEYILNTKPDRAMGPKKMYLYLNPNSSAKEWDALDEQKKVLYERRSVFDRKRARFSMSVWISKLVAADLDSPDLNIDDLIEPKLNNDLRIYKDLLHKDILFEIPRERSNKFLLFVKDFTTKEHDKCSNIVQASAIWDSEKRKLYKSIYEKNEKLRKEKSAILIEELSRRGLQSDFLILNSLFKHSTKRYISNLDALLPRLPLNLSFIKSKSLDEIQKELDNEKFHDCYTNVKNLIIEYKTAQMEQSKKLLKVNKFIKEAEDLEELKVGMGLIVKYKTTSGRERTCLDDIYRNLVHHQ